ncbi:Endochitinase 4 [Dissostichus eleginoides]|uniref:Endochitinase 4 n=1 Tax=Dissostichus eleginoides TaxID=100907 RepID=A0AAD9CMQ5_DISEL|nr:Endochitinase 4 [Dissostichus eleginoides]
MFSGGEEVWTGTRAVVSSQPENASPPGSVYQAGELSTYTQILEQGNSEQETEALVPSPGPPRSESAGQGYARPSLTSEPRPEANTGGVVVPFRFYDLFFLNGEYPPGTVSFSSDSYEQGRDSFQDVHYVRDYFPNNHAPVQRSQAAAAAPVQNFYAPRIPVMAGSGRDGAKTASPRGFRQPSATRTLATTLVMVDTSDVDAYSMNKDIC